MKSRYLLFFLPLIVAKYTSAETVQPFHSPEESVNSQFYLRTGTEARKCCAVVLPPAVTENG